MSNTTTLLIDEKHLDPAMSLKVYQALIAWAASRGTRFEITLQPSAYDNPDDLLSLRALGDEEASPHRLPGAAQIVGKPGPSLAATLTSKQAPPGAIAGDNSPAEDVVIFVGDRRLYGSYDYGRTQLFNVTDSEAAEVREILRSLGLGPEVLIPAPSGLGAPGSG